MPKLSKEEFVNDLAMALYENVLGEHCGTCDEPKPVQKPLKKAVKKPSRIRNMNYSVSTYRIPASAPAWLDSYIPSFRSPMNSHDLGGNPGD